MKTKMPNGQEYTFAPATFSNDTVELMEFMASSGDDENRTMKDHVRILRLLRNVVKDSMLRGGHSEAEAEAFLSSVPLGKEMKDYAKAFMTAVGID